MIERRARRRTGENRARLLEAGITVFGRRGFHGASTSEIARVAAVPQPHVYQHFSSKLDLFLATVDLCASRTGLLKARQQTAGSGDSASSAAMSSAGRGSAAVPGALVDPAPADDHIMLVFQCTALLRDPDLQGELRRRIQTVRQTLGPAAWAEVILDGARLLETTS